MTRNKPKNMLIFKHLIPITVLCCFCCGDIQAESGLVFRHLTRNEGLLHDNATCIAQDSIGYIWLGTHRGLNRYDGYSIDSYRYDNGKINSVYYNRVYAVEIVGNMLWMATEAGIACFDIRKKQYVDVEIDDSENLDFYRQVRSLKRGYDNLLWFFTDLNCIRLGKVNYNPDANKYIITPCKIGSETAFLSEYSNPKLTFDETGNVWLSGKNNISCYSRGSDGEFYFAGYVEQNIGQGIKDMRYENGSLWIAYWDRIVKYSIIGVTEMKPVRTIAYSWRNVLAFYLDDNFIWLGSDHGVLQIGKEGAPPLMIEYTHNPLNAHSIGNDPNNIFLDRNSNIWISTWGAGVSFANTSPKFFQTINYSPYPSEGTIDAEFVSSIHHSSDNFIYLGTKYGGISRLNVKNKKAPENFCRTPQLLPAVTCIKSDANDIFAAVNNTVVIIGKQNRQTKEVLQTARHIFWLEFDRFDRLWTATHAGLECFEKHNGKWLKKITLSSTTTPALSTDLLHNIYSDKEKNELMITSSFGINRLIFKENGDIKNIVHYVAKENKSGSLSSNFLWSIDRQNDSVYWIGSMGSGLNRFTLIDRPSGTYDYTCEVYGVESGAPSGDIESVEIDKYENIWCGGFSLSCFDTKLKRFNVFDINDGLQSYMFGTSSSCKDNDGVLYFGGAKGMNYFMPTPNTTDSGSSSVFFSRVYVNGKLMDSDIEFSRNLVLDYPDNNFTLDFTSLSFNPGQHIRYRYRLEGYDNEWRYIEMGKEPRVSYRKLPSGSYLLTVEAGGWKDWKGSFATMTLRVKPPFWLSLQAILIYAIIGLILIYAFIRYFLQWMQMKQTIAMQTEREQQKEEMMQLKMRFFTDVSHEFKTPLTLINSAIEELSEEELSLNGNKHFGVIKRNNNKLLNLIRELFDFHRSDVKEASLKTTRVSVQDFISQIYAEFQDWASLSGISMSLTMPEEKIVMWIDEEHFGKMATNILSNSIRYSEAGGKIDIEISTGNVRNKTSCYEFSFRCLDSLYGNSHLIISVRDTGVGISPESLPKIFERFYQVESKTSKHLGSGIGLALVRSLVRLHHGGIVVSSKRNTGTEIILALPLDDGYLKKGEKVDTHSFELSAYLSDYVTGYENIEIIPAEEENPENKPTILLADDNQEMLMMLREHFKHDYNIVLAFDGEEAFSKCNTHFPDLVISDVMMPKMDGIEFCAQLKKYLRTCFIPVILLTAKSLVEHQIEGIESGAEAYIPKPFDVRLLRATVRNLLARSVELKNFIPVKTAADKRMKSLDAQQQAYFSKLTELVEANMNNPGFSVNHLCLELGINRSKLYSTIKTITGTTMGHYILKLRLDKAADLLKNTGMTITEVGYQIGIESPSYFTKAFKAQFGRTPSEFAKDVRK
ncbi:MAG: response regulator [Dysgonamonadaceae bacterium]|jgi:signal transduction histidine kinase/DNA-binding response OmpR family regulator/ligand-binding sensor domain-containing protein|nr:response regulator [Dysgonamonadaceae bacterium]